MEQRKLQDAELPQNACYELARCGEGNALFRMELGAYKRLFEEDKNIDNSYKVLLTSLLSNEERLILERTTTQKVKEEADESSLHLPTKEVNTDKPHKKQGGKAQASECDYVVHADSGKVIEEGLGAHKERKSKHLLIGHEDAHVNAVKALTERREPHEKRNGKGLLFVKNNVRENSSKASQERTEPHRKREGKEHLTEHEDVHENAGKTLAIISEPHHKRKGLLVLRDCVREKPVKAFEDITEPHLKRQGKEHFIENNDIPENGVKENDHTHYEPFLKYFKKYGGNKSSAGQYKKDSSNVDIKHEEDISSAKDSETKKFPTSELRNNSVRKRSRRYEDVKSEIERCPARELRNVVTKKKMVFHDEEEPTDEEIETKKCLPSKFRDAALRNCRKYEVGVEKRLGSKFRNVSISNKNINGNDNEDEDEFGDDDIDEEEKSDDSDVEIIESLSCQKGTPVGGNGRVTPNESNVEFRRQVLELISKPYDEIEYKVVKKTFQDGCYIENYPDLRKVLKKYRYNQRKCLAILRGFYFWRQNVYREGAFQPWTDDMCLAVEP